MLRALLITMVVIMAGCEATAVKDTSAIRTKQKLNEDLSLPVQLPIAYYVDKSEPTKGVNFYGKLEDVTELVAGDMFSGATKLTTTSDFQYLLYLKTVSKWDRNWGFWSTNLELQVISRQGEVLHIGNVDKTSRGGGPYDYDAVHNGLAAALKEVLVGFLNKQGKELLALAEKDYQQVSTPIAKVSDLIKDLKPSSTGTGFYINRQGSVATAAHVVDECLYVEVMHKGTPKVAEVKHASNLLDLAVIQTEYESPHHAAISRSNTTAKLGKQVFVTGFPLSGILADYPSLTVGNVSSMGGLKGAKGHFQFSAPVQPGNSGGAIVDYKGNLVGMVSSSLNQAMLLEKSGTTAQNLNFGVDLSLVKKFLDKYNIHYAMADRKGNFETASAAAVEYTNQVLCYQ